MFSLQSSVLISLFMCLALWAQISLQQARPSYIENPNYNYRSNDRGDPTNSQDNSLRYFNPHPVDTMPDDPNLIAVPRLGRVRGKLGHNVFKNRQYKSYLGLHYATVSPGLGRFQKASPVQRNSNSIIDAVEEPANCPQFPELQKIRDAERNRENVDDCLTLNIHVPNKSGSFPILVFVHGEMLFDGGAVEGQPDYFLEHDVMLISINYRLGPFGFLSTLTDEMPGNVALSDIQLALEWIQHYIRPFGGNPEQVTLFGQAGGASLVHALSLSNQAQGLFHKIILQSGTALNPYFLDENPIETAALFARHLKCNPYSSLAQCISRNSTTELLQSFQSYLEQGGGNIKYHSTFKLVVGDRLGYLPMHPAALAGNNQLPMIAGVTKDAGAFIMTSFYDELTALRTRNISEYIHRTLAHIAPMHKHHLWHNWALQHIFTEDDVRNPNLHSIAQGLLELVNLVLFRGPIIDSIQYTYREYPTYLYCFDYRGEHHRFRDQRNPLPFETDATLSDDNIYLFPYPEEVSRLNPEDMTMARAMTTMWVNFAQYNIPNLNQGVWPNVSSQYGPFLRFTNSKEHALELDYHFGEGIPVPNIYPQYFTTTTSTTSTTSTTTTTASPSYEQRYPNYPRYSAYNNPRYPPTTQPPSRYRPYETVLGSNDNDEDYLPHHQPEYPRREELSQYSRHPTRY